MTQSFSVAASCLWLCQSVLPWSTWFNTPTQSYEEVWSDLLTVLSRFFFVCVCMCVRVIVTLPQSFFFPLCWTICCIVRCIWGPVTCAFMYFTTAQRERRVSCKEAFIPHLSERWCREKKERRIPVCDCVCVQDCVRVFREDGACFFGRDMFLQGPSLKETVKSRFVLLVLCPQKGEVQETCDCVPPCLRCCNRPFFVRWQHRPRVWGIVASGGKKKEVTRLCDNVRSCTKKKKKKLRSLVV